MPGSRHAFGPVRADHLRHRVGAQLQPVLALVLVVMSLAPALAAPPVPRLVLGTEPEVRVLIARVTQPLRVACQGEVLVLSGDRYMWRHRVMLSPSGVTLDGASAVAPLELVPLRGFLGLAGKTYRGSLMVLRDGEGLAVVNRVALEDYLMGVVPKELLCKEPEAMKAQAVVARTYALARLKPGQPYDLVAGPSNQVYGGVEAECPAADAAVQATRGLVVSWHGHLAGKVVYHSTCGGRTADNENVFDGSPVPYLRSVLCAPGPGQPAYCSASPWFRWQARVTSAELLKELSPVLGKRSSPITGLKVVRAGPSGEVLELEVTGPDLSLDLGGEQVRSLLKVHRVGGHGLAPLPSGRFQVEASQRPGVFRLLGKGWGHGVGMCQWGAIGMARAGKGYRAILAHFFRGTRVCRWDSTATAGMWRQ